MVARFSVQVGGEVSEHGADVGAATQQYARARGQGLPAILFADDAVAAAANGGQGSVDGDAYATWRDALEDADDPGQPYKATLGDGEVTVDPSIDARFIRSYYCRIVTQPGNTQTVRAASAQEAAEIYAEGFRGIEGEDYADERVTATRLDADDELDMSDTAETTI